MGNNFVALLRVLDVLERVGFRSAHEREQWLAGLRLTDRRPRTVPEHAFDVHPDNLRNGPDSSGHPTLICEAGTRSTGRAMRDALRDVRAIVAKTRSETPIRNGRDVRPSLRMPHGDEPCGGLGVDALEILFGRVVGVTRGVELRAALGRRYRLRQHQRAQSLHLLLKRAAHEGVALPRGGMPISQPALPDARSWSAHVAMMRSVSCS